MEGLNRVKTLSQLEGAQADHAHAVGDVADQLEVAGVVAAVRHLRARGEIVGENASTGRGVRGRTAHSRGLKKAWKTSMFFSPNLSVATSSGRPHAPYSSGV